MEKTAQELRGSLALITGASSGIGYELAKVFAQNGFNLIVVAEDPGIVEAGSAFRALGVKVEALQIDLANYDGVEKLYAKVQSMGQPLEVACINAGVGVDGNFTETSLEKEINLIQLNITSAVHLTKRILPDFVSRGHGRILFTSSIAAEMAGPYYAVYAASKAFLQSFSEAIHYEVKDKGVVITTLQPGATDTNFFARADMLDTKAGVSKKDDPALVAQQGFDALMAGEDKVVGGSFMNKVQAVVGKLVSDQQGAGLHAAQTKPGSANK